MSKHVGKWPRIGPREILFWRGRQWSVTSRGLDKRAPASMWIPLGAAREGWDAPDFNPNCIALCRLARNHWVDVEDLIEAYQEARIPYQLPITHFDAATAYARLHNARAIARHEARQAEGDALEAAGKSRWLAGVTFGGEPWPAL